MLTLPIKKKWFDMILSGEKKEEYREIKPYYATRFANLYKTEGGTNLINSFLHFKGLRRKEKPQPIYIMFRNGYSKDSPSFIAKCTLSIGTGKEEWGAEKDKEYFILTVQEILKGSED